ncbi:MAG: protein translocase subunit SecD [Alphaproteobacteria bacterium]|nr:protein translocase subunit SecD [Alphaproteobacteria bacterium]MDD9920164.1 protein translocase subunit SecD [Alphaproteobacteria bacterium]
MLKFNLFTKLSILALIGWAVVTAAPNVLPESWQAHLPSSMPTKTLNLGLDLQGGSHLVLQVETQAVIQRAYENLEDDVRQSLREAKVGYLQLRADAVKVSFVLRNPQDEATMREALSELRNATVSIDGQQVFVVFRDEELERLATTALRQTLEVLRNRVDEFGVAEPLIQQQGADRVIVELPGIDDVQRAKNAIGRTAQLTFHLVDAQADPTNPFNLPPNRKVMMSQDGYSIVVHKRAALTGQSLTSAGASFDQYSQPAVDIAFDNRGTRIFAKLSTENVGRQFAIVLDGEVLSAPVFREPILGGRAQISGSFTVQESQDLATLLSAGALPAPVKVVEERTVGPSLGADSVAAGQLAILIGFVMVLIFMVIFYGMFGLAADVALLVNVIIVLAVMTYVGFTLTLPGMAGIVLTIGMAVDANVLIFERIREEVAKGQRPFTAMENGFKGAFGTILDANITTLLAAVVLFAMGSGPIRGFALTLSIGIVASMFTAIMLTRWMLVAWLHAAKPKKLKV